MLRDRVPFDYRGIVVHCSKRAGKFRRLHLHERPRPYTDYRYHPGGVAWYRPWHRLRYLHDGGDPRRGYRRKGDHIRNYHRDERHWWSGSEYALRHGRRALGLDVLAGGFSRAYGRTPDLPDDHQCDHRCRHSAELRFRLPAEVHQSLRRGE